MTLVEESGVGRGSGDPGGARGSVVPAPAVPISLGGRDSGQCRAEVVAGIGGDL